MRELHKNTQSLISILCKTSSRTYDQSDAALEDILLVPRNPKYKLEILSAKNVRMFRIGPQNYDFNPKIKW